MRILMSRIQARCGDCPRNEYPHGSFREDGDKPFSSLRIREIELFEQTKPGALDLHKAGALCVDAAALAT
jgi:hypothetical protein